MSCGYAPSDTGNLAGLIGYVDCSAGTIGEGGYLALAAPGSASAAALTGLLAIFVALYGYRLLLGGGARVADAVGAALKVGAVLTLATAWPAYQPLVYNLVIGAPAELATAVAGGAGLPGAGDLASRLDDIDQNFQQLQVYGGGTAPTGVQAGIAQPIFTGSDTVAIGAARITFLVGSVGPYALVRLFAGVLVALGPVFVAFLLFEGTRGLFVGWLRGLAGAVLAATAVSVVLGLEIVLLDPWVADVAARRAGSAVIAGAPPQIFAVCLVFAGVLAGAVRLSVAVAAGLRQVPARWATVPAPALPAPARAETLARQDGPVSRVAAIDGGRPRVAAIVDAVGAAERREALVLASRGDGSRGRGVTPVAAALAPARAAGAASGGEPGLLAPGASERRRIATRASASASRRDRP